MTAHTCTALNPGCYRCDLNLDEIRAAEEDAVMEAQHAEMCVLILREEECDCGLDDALMSMYYAGIRAGADQ